MLGFLNLIGTFMKKVNYISLPIFILFFHSNVLANEGINKNDETNKKVEVSNNLSYNNTNNSYLRSEFKRLTALQVIIDECSEQSTLENKNGMISNINEYSSYLSSKEHLSAEEVLASKIQLKLEIEDKLGAIIPASLCQSAIEKTQMLLKNWNREENSQLLGKLEINQESE